MSETEVGKTTVVFDVDVARDCGQSSGGRPKPFWLR